MSDEVPSVNPRLDAMCEMLKTIHDLNEKNKLLEAQIEKMKKYLDCDFCEYQNNKDECHQCNYLEKTKWTLKGDKEK